MSVSPKKLRVAIDGDLEIVAGDNITWEMTVKNVEDNSVPDITGATLTLTVKANKTDASASFARTVGDGITLTDPTNGIFQLSLIPSNTSSLTPKAYFCDIQMTLSTLVDTILLGTLEIIRGVT